MAEKFFPRVAVLLVLSLVSSSVFASRQKGENATFDPGRMLTSTALVSSPVVGPDGTSIATVDRLLIDADTGRIEFVLLSFPGEDDRLVAVPWSYLERQEDRMRLVASEEQLAGALRMEVTALASATPGGPANQEATANRISYAPSSTNSNYAAGEKVSMSGTVVGTLTAPLQGDTDHRVVYVNVGETEEVRLHLGPDWYLKERGVNVEPGDLLSFSGSRAPEEEETIVQVNELRVNGRTIVLRNPQGIGMWRVSGSRN